MDLQDVLIDLRGKAQREWPDATDQEIQDFFEHIAWRTQRDCILLTEREVWHLISQEPWYTFRRR
jgi:hypothetical protein